MDKFDYMQVAINEAKKCEISDDVPVGAVIVCGDRIIAKAHNQKVKKSNPLCHAEILAIDKAVKKINDFRLNNMQIYVTKEPCLMCMGALLSARIGKIYYGAPDLRFGTSYLASDNNFNHKCDIEGSILEKECAELLKQFFLKIR